jgi:Flp pilus assembly protein CpaB
MLRRSPRALALWGAALVVAVITATVVAGDLASLHRRAAGLGPELDAVVAERDLAVGRVITNRDLASRRVHRAQLPDPVVTDREAVLGRVVAVPILRGTFVARGNVAPRRRTGLDGVVPTGMRAMRVVVTDAVDPRPGAAVDVLATYDPAAAAATGTDTTVVVAHGVTVLAADRRASSGSGRAGARGVTLLVDPEQATALADAQANGVVTLALVPPEDADSAHRRP